MIQVSRRWGFVWFGLIGLTALGCGNGGSAAPDGGLPATDAIPDVETVRVSGPLLVASPDSITAVEGDPLGATFAVSLGAPYPVPVTVNVTTSDHTVASVLQDTLVFPANELGPQQVTVLGTPDDDTAPNSALITLSAPDAANTTVHVAVTDVNKQALVASPTQVYMQAGETTQLGIRLQFRPSAPLTVKVTSPNPAVLTVTPATLTFAADSTYSILQPVTVMAIPGAITGDTMVTLGVSAVGVDTVLPVPVLISDPNALGLTVTPSSLSLVEGKAPGTVMVSLTKPPPTDIAVSITSSNTAQALPSAAGLTFTASNYSTPQAVTVTPQANNDLKDETATITFAVTTAVSPPIAARTVSVAIATDQRQAIKVSPAALTLNQGASTTFDVWLAFSPSTPATVNAFSSNPARVTVTPPNLIFNPTNFGAHQTITVQGLMADDLADVMANITLTSVVADSVTIPVTVKNTNPQALQAVYGTAPTAIVMQESQLGGPPSTTTFGVNLAFNPSADVTVTLNGSDDSRLTLSKSVLTFNPATGKSPGRVTQFVTLTAIHDPDLLDNDLTLTVSSLGLAAVTVPLVILDVDVEKLTVSKDAGGTPLASISTTEGDPTTVFYLGLTQLPPVPLTISLTSLDPRASVMSSVILDGTANVRIPVTLPHDDDADPNVVTIMIHANDATFMIPDRVLTIIIADVDKQAILIGSPASAPDTPPAAPTMLSPPSPSVSLAIHESAATGSTANLGYFFVALNAQPDSETTVYITSSSQSGEVTTTPSRTFTTDDWKTPQLVTVTGHSDSNLSTDQFSIKITAPTLTVSDQFVTVTVIDDDQQALYVSPLDPNPDPKADPDQLTEGDKTGRSFTVHLTQEPLTITTVTVTVPPSAANSFGVSQTMGSAGTNSISLTFYPSSYLDVQTVWVTALPDVNTNNERTSIDVSLPSFAGSQQVMVSSLDSNKQTIEVAFDQDWTMPIITATVPPTSPMPAPLPGASELVLTENAQSSTNSTSTKTVWVKLAYPPHGASPSETILITTNPKVTASTPSLTFSSAASGTSGSWNMPQSFTVTSVADDDASDELNAVTLRTDLGGTESDRSWVALDTTLCRVSDLDLSVTLTSVSATSLNADGSGAPVTVNVSLSKAPPSPVTVNIASDSAKVTFDTTSVMFPANDVGPHSFKIKGNQQGTGSVMITLSGGGLNFGATEIPAPFSLTVN